MTPAWSSPSRSTAEERREDRHAAEVVVGPVDRVHEPAHRRAVGVRRRAPRRRRRGPGTASAIRSRRSRSTAVSASVTNDRSGFRVVTGFAPEVASSRSRRPRRTSRARPRPSHAARRRVPRRSDGAPVRAEDRDAAAAHDRIRAPSGSHSGSLRDLEADPLAEDLDLAARPDRRLVGRQVGVGDRALDGEPVAAATSPGRRSRRRPGPARCRGRRSAGRRGRGSAGASAARPPSPRRAPRGR